MPLSDHQLPEEIIADIGHLLERLAAAGYRPEQSQFSPEYFGNFFVDVLGPKRGFRIVKDRSQYFVEGPQEELERADLWKAFDDRNEFEGQLLAWLEGSEA